MSSKLNVETKENISSEIKRLQQKCLDVCEIIENTPFDASLTPDNVGEKALNYVEGLRVEIENSQTQIPTDENLIVSQLLADMKVKTEQVEELIAFTRGSILDVENEIQRYVMSYFCYLIFYYFRNIIKNIKYINIDLLTIYYLFTNKFLV